MSRLFKKLNLGDRTRILVTNAPSSFESELNQLRGVNVIKRCPKGQRDRLHARVRHQTARAGCRGKSSGTKDCRRCHRMVRLSQRIVKELHVRIQSRYRMVPAGPSRIRRRTHGGNRRRLVGGPFPACGVYQEHGARQETGDDEDG